MWVVVLIVVLAGLAMWLTGRNRQVDGFRAVDEIVEDGLVVDGTVVPWASVFDVRVNTRRSFSGTWFGFEVSTEDAGLLSVDGGGGRGERFLSHSHRLPGFDHQLLQDALVARRSGVVCYNR